MSELTLQHKTNILTNKEQCIQAKSASSPEQGKLVVARPRHAEGGGGRVSI